MIYPFMTLPDNTEITHTQMREDGTVKVYIETPDEKDGFHKASCILPAQRWEDVVGYSESEMSYFRELVNSTAHLILEFSQTGGVLNASNF